MKPNGTHLEAFVRGLPEGLDSYPDVVAKASLCRTLLEDAPRLDVEVLPDPVRELVVDPAPVSSWIPEAHLHALMCAVRDASADEAAFTAHSYARWRALFEGPLYKIMFAVARPSLLVRASSMRWRTFHRGSPFDVFDVTDAGAIATVRHPPGLWSRVASIGLVEGLRAILELGGAKRVVLEFEPGQDMLRIVGRWES